MSIPQHIPEHRKYCSTKSKRGYSTIFHKKLQAMIGYNMVTVINQFVIAENWTPVSALGTG
jgi:hypothetical protein